MKDRITSEGARRALSPGLQGFLWYLSETTDDPIQEFRLEPGLKFQHIVHSQKQGHPNKEYDVTVGKSEICVSTDLVVRREGSCGSMMLMEEYMEEKNND